MSEEIKRPKGCEGCQKPCSVFFTRIINGEATNLGMCSECPTAKTLLDPAQHGLSSLLAGLAPSELETGEKCPVCGFTPVDFQRLNRFGCPHCYEYLSGFIHTLIARAQHGHEHHGKSPKHHRGASVRARIEIARNELDAAVLREDFESAARLRDEIKGLESGVSGGGPPMKSGGDEPPEPDMPPPRTHIGEPPPPQHSGDPPKPGSPADPGPSAPTP